MNRRVILVVSLAVGCGGTDEADYRYGIAHVDSVAVVSQSATLVSFRAYAGFPTPCWDYTGASVEGMPSAPPKATAEVRVSLNGRIPTGGGCADIWFPFEQVVDIVMPGPGTYRFRFSTRHGSTVDTTLVVR